MEKIKIRHDNGGFSSDWFLDRVEIDDGYNRFVFPCERWLSKSKEDKKIERVLFEKVDALNPAGQEGKDWINRFLRARFRTTKAQGI